MQNFSAFAQFGQGCAAGQKLTYLTYVYLLVDVCPEDLYDCDPLYFQLEENH